MRTRLQAGPIAVLLTLGGGWALADPIKVPVGTLVELELQHHVNAAYVPAGSPIYFRVAKDLSIDGQAVIRKGTVVTGKMEQAQKPGMVGRSGTMALGVRTVTAVDGTGIPVDCDLSKQGRSRGGATLGWTLFWGIPGLITRGVNPYLERGTSLDAEVTYEASVDPTQAVAPADEAPMPQDECDATQIRCLESGCSDVRY